MLISEGVAPSFIPTEKNVTIDIVNIDGTEEKGMHK
jgi:hypothetical protein